MLNGVLLKLSSIYTKLPPNCSWSRQEVSENRSRVFVPRLRYAWVFCDVLC